MLRKQDTGTGQSSGSKTKDDYVKDFERIVSGVEIFEGGLSLLIFFQKSCKEN